MKIALISGASAGIGKEIVRLLDQRGLDELWLIGRNKERLESFKKELKTTTKCFSFDLGRKDTFEAIGSALHEEKCEIEYLVCSAGVGYNGKLEDVSMEHISNMIEVNCIGLSLLIKVSLPYISNKGRVINIASGAGFLPQPGFSVYAGTKSYVISLSRALSQELRERKITVTAVCPGPVDTEFFSSLENVSQYKKRFLIAPDKLAKGILRASDKKKTVYTPTFSIKLVHLISKILPTSWVLKFYK